MALPLSHIPSIIATFYRHLPIRLQVEVRGTFGSSDRITKIESFDRPQKPQMFLRPYILFWHKESYLTILMFLDYSIVREL